MEKLYSVAELAARWNCTEKTARQRMRQIGILGRPMMCRESLIEAWERRNTTAPEWPHAPGIPKGGKRRQAAMAIQQGPLKPGQFISRVRIKPKGA